MSDCETSVIWHGNTLVDEHVGFPFVAYIADIFMCVYIYTDELYSDTAIIQPPCASNFPWMVTSHEYPLVEIVSISLSISMLHILGVPCS